MVESLAKTTIFKKLIRFLSGTATFLLLYLASTHPSYAQGLSCNQITLAAIGFQGMTSGTVGAQVKAEAAQHETRTCDNWTGQCTMTVVNQSTGEIACGVEDLNCGTSSVSCPAGGKRFNVSIVSEPVGYNCRLNTDHVCLANASDNGVVQIYCDPDPVSNLPTPTPTPTVSLKVNNNSCPTTINIAHNTSATLNWTSSNASSCTASGNWSGTKSTSGTESTGNLSGPATYQYSLSCSGSETKTCTVNAQAPPIPGTPNCQARSLGCSGLTCSFAVDSYYNGTINPPSYKIQLRPNTGDSIFTNWQNNGTTLSHKYTAGSYTAEVYAAMDTNSTSKATCGQFQVSPQSNVTSPPGTTPTPTPTPSTPLECASCPNDGGQFSTNYKWQQCGIGGDSTRCYDGGDTESGCYKKSGNDYPAELGRRCYVSQTSFSGSPKNIYGRFLLRTDPSDPSTETTLPDSGDGSIFDTDGNGVYWWNYRSGLYPYQLCQMRSFYQGTEFCYQPSGYDMEGTFSTEAPLHYQGSAGNNVGAKKQNQLSDIPTGYVHLNVWNNKYIPIGYYTYQNIQGTGDFYCRDNQNCGDNVGDGSDRYKCDPRCGNTCRKDDCKVYLACRRTPGQYAAMTTTPTTPNTNIDDLANRIASYCSPDNGNARVDVVFAQNNPTVSGTISIDTNGDNTCDTSYDGSGGSSNAILRLNNSSGNVVDVESANSSGNYTFNQSLQFDQQYWVGLALPIGYQLISANPSSQNATPISSNANPRVDFCIRQIPAGPWFQTKDADVQSSGNISSNIPQQCVASSQCTEQFGLAGDGGYPGVPAASETTSFGQGTPNPRNWDVEGSPYTGRRYDYNYFAALAPPAAFTDTASLIADTQISGGNLVSGYQSGGYVWRYRNGDLTINSTANLGNNKTILIVNGNLTIGGRITLTKGQGFFATIVRGNINVSSSVTHTGQKAPGNSGPGLEGIYLADGTINTGTTGTGDDQLYARGSLVGLSGVNLQRNLSGSDDDTNPAEFIEYAPDLVFTFPRDLLRQGIVWREIAP